jgi:hypothetical protein
MGGLPAAVTQRPGHSKDQRSDSPLLPPGPGSHQGVLDGSGFVRRSEVFDGDVAEARILAGMLPGL